MEEKGKGSWVRLSMDDIRKFVMPDGKFSRKKEVIARKLQKAMALSLKENGFSVIFDDTNLNPKTLNRVKVFAEENGFKFEVKNFCKDITKEDVCEFMIRDDRREKRVGGSVIYKMSFQYFPEIYKEDKFVVCDIDGTVANVDHRLHYVKGEEKDWKGFFSEMADDELIESTVYKLIEYKKQGYPTIFVSARPEEYRKVTENWLLDKLFLYRSKNNFKNPIKIAGLIMRETGDRRDDTETKSDIYEKYLKNLNIETVIDDRPKVVRMWESKGLNVINVGSGKEF